MRSLECEKRAMLTFDQYKRLVADYIGKYVDYKIIDIENIYFEDDNFSLKANHSILRKRIIDGNKEELTLKIKGDKGDIEINETMESHPEIDKELNYKFNNYHPLTSLKTKRIEIEIDDYLLVIDQNFYNGIIDYDVEVEAPTIEKAEKVILDICDKYGVIYKKDYPSKTFRAIASMKNK